MKPMSLREMVVTQLLSWFLTSIYNIFPSGSPVSARTAPVTGNSLLFIPPVPFLESALCESGLLSPERTYAVTSLPAGSHQLCFSHSTWEPLRYLKTASSPHVSSLLQAKHHWLIFFL